MAESPADMLEWMIHNLEEKTGRSLDDWVAAVRRSGLDRHGAIVKWLKSEHGLGHGYANLVASKALEPAAGRLEASGSFNGMVSHRVRVATAAEVDDELFGWLRQAYDRA